MEEVLAAERITTHRNYTQILQRVDQLYIGLMQGYGSTNVSKLEFTTSGNLYRLLGQIG